MREGDVARGGGRAGASRQAGGGHGWTVLGCVCVYCNPEETYSKGKQGGAVVTYLRIMRVEVLCLFRVFPSESESCTQVLQYRMINKILKKKKIVNDNVTCKLFKLATTRRPFRFFFLSP